MRSPAQKNLTSNPSHNKNHEDIPIKPMQSAFKDIIDEDEIVQEMKAPTKKFSNFLKRGTKKQFVPQTNKPTDLKPEYEDKLIKTEENEQLKEMSEAPPSIKPEPSQQEEQRQEDIKARAFLKRKSQKIKSQKLE